MMAKAADEKKGVREKCTMNFEHLLIMIFLYIVLYMVFCSVFIFLCIIVLLIIENIVTLLIINKKHNIYGISNCISASIDWRGSRKV